jgi:hypothetical protein
MPFAGFPDFEACVEEQLARDHGEEAARKICGSLQADLEKGKAARGVCTGCGALALDGQKCWACGAQPTSKCACKVGAAIAGARSTLAALKKATFRKVPVTVQAEQLKQPQDVETLEGTMHGNAGDWLVTGVAGENYIVADHIFRRTFAPADANGMWQQKDDMSVGDLASGGGLLYPGQAGVRGQPPSPQLAGNDRNSPARKIPRALMKPGTRVQQPKEPVKPMTTKDGGGARLHISTESVPVAPGVARARGALAAIKPNSNNVAKKGKTEKAPDPPPQPYQANFQGIPVYVDRPKGFVQRGRNEATGEDWEREYKCDYGYIPGTLGGDGQGLDVFLGDKADSPDAHWIQQKKADGSFDEYKVMFGFKDRNEAKDMYLQHVPKKYFGTMATMSTDLVKALLGIEPAGQMIGKAFTYAMKYAARAEGASFGEHARAWVKSRGLLDKEADYGGELGKSILRLANSFSRDGHSGMSAILARAQFNFLCDAWDGMHTLILNDKDFEKARTALEKAMKALADNTCVTFGPGIVNLPHQPLVDQDEFNAPPPNAREIEHDLRRTPVADPNSALDGKQPAAANLREPDALDPKPVAKNLVRLVNLKKDAAPAPAPPAAASSPELNYIMGIVLEPDVVDSQNDTYDADEIRKAEWLFMTNFRNVGIQHKVLVNGQVNIVESFIAPVDMTIQGTAIKAGTWLMGMHVTDPVVWQQIKNGELTGLSIAGLAEKTPL